MVDISKDIPFQSKKKLGDLSELTTAVSSHTTQLAGTATDLVERGANVKKFGAKGDGITDDTNAIQATIDYISSLGGGKVFFPKGTYVIKKIVYVRSNGVYLEGIGKKGVVINCATGGKIYFANDDWDNLVPTNPLYNTYNNLSRFNDSGDYFNVVEYGGANNRVANVGIKNITFNVLTTDLDSVLYFFKVDDFTVENIDVIFANPTSVIQTTTYGDPIRVYYSSRFKFNNVTVADNHYTTFAVFIHWCHGFELNDVKVGNANTRGIEIKHGVWFTLNRCQAIMTGSIPSSSVGIRIAYSSRQATVKNCYVSGFDSGYSYGSSEVYDYSYDIHTENSFVENCNASFRLEHLKRFSFKNIKVTLKIYGFVFENFYKQTGDALYANDANFTKNTDFYTYDHDYDAKTRMTYFGVDHYRYYTYKNIPLLLDGKFEDIHFTVDQAKIPSDGSTEAALFKAYNSNLSPADFVIPSSSFVANNRIKRFGDKLDLYPFSINNVNFQNIYISVSGTNISDSTKRGRFVTFDSPLTTYKGCKFGKFNYNFNTLPYDANDLYGNVAEYGFMRGQLLIDCEFDLTELAKYTPANTFITINGFENLVMRGVKAHVGNFSGNDATSTSTRFLIKIVSTGTWSGDERLIYEVTKGLVVENSKMNNIKNILNIGYSEGNLSNYGAIRFNKNTIDIYDSSQFSMTNSSKPLYQNTNLLNGVIFYRSRAGTPIANFTPLFIGEEVFDTTNKVWFKAVGTTNADWK